MNGGILRRNRTRADLTNSSSNVWGQSEDAVVRSRHLGMPHIRKGSFNEHQRWTTKEAREETAGGESGEAIGEAGTQGEKHEDGQGDEIHHLPAETLTHMRSVDRGQGDSIKVERHSQDRGGHGDVEAHNDF